VSSVFTVLCVVIMHSPESRFLFLVDTYYLLTLVCIRDEVTGEWRNLHNEELRDLYCLPSIIRIIKSRRMRLAGHVA
jgi:hypothetical protein